METAVGLADDGRSAVEALYRADAPRLWGAICAFTGDPDMASDAVAESYAQLLHRGAGVRDPAAWVWRTAFQIARGHLKARSTTRPLSQEPAPSSQSRLDRYGDPDLVKAVQQLPDSQRAAVVLFYYADLPIRQIAERLGTNSLAVRVNLSRGRRRLRELLGEQHG
jgi:RNA polymerase sigma-70 factor (ECF subfamily)